MPITKITAEDLVYSRSREEIQSKLQNIFGTYEDLKRMDLGEIPLTVEGDVSLRYMADIEHAAGERDLDETRALLKEAYDEIAEGYAEGVLPAYRPWLVAELVADWEEKQALQRGRVPNHNTVVEYDRGHTLGELREMCQSKGLTVSGDKKTLARRLITEV